MTRPPDESSPDQDPPQEREADDSPTFQEEPAAPPPAEEPGWKPPSWSNPQMPPPGPARSPGPPFSHLPPPPPVAEQPRPDRDRLSLNLAWEGILAVVATVLVLATLATTPERLITSSLDQIGYLGLTAAALAFSLRTGSPNLAVGSIVGFSATLGAYLATEEDWPRPVALIVAVGLATIVGFLLGVVVAVLSVPAWAVTLGAATILQAISLGIAQYRRIPFDFDSGSPTALWFGLFTVISVGGGLLWLIPAIRRPLSALRSPGEPGDWAGLQPGLAAVVGLTGSGFLAGLAGIALLMRLRSADILAGENLTVFAFAAVLLGGVSVFGRRAGIFGTFLGVIILAITQTLLNYNDVEIWVTRLILGLIIIVGLTATRGLESTTKILNNRRPALSPPA
ncbi:MAG: ABC transporter permease [Streptosporangiaceae bacterium]